MVSASTPSANEQDKDVSQFSTHRTATTNDRSTQSPEEGIVL